MLGGNGDDVFRLDFDEESVGSSAAENALGSRRDSNVNESRSSSDGSSANEHISDSVSPCGQCARDVSNDDEAVLCDSCQRWWHRECAQISAEDYKTLDRLKSFPWTCFLCKKRKDKSPQ